jgi:hypothetical protein
VIFQTGNPVKNPLKTAWLSIEYPYKEGISYACSINTNYILDIVEPTITNIYCQFSLSNVFNKASTTY